MKRVCLFLFLVLGVTIIFAQDASATNFGAGLTWTQTTANTQWGERENLSSVVYDNKIWIIGGWNGGATVYNDVWYSADGTTWTQATAKAQWIKRYYHTSLVYNAGSGDQMWVIGGYGTDWYNDVWYSSDGTAWTQQTARAQYGGREGHVSLVYNNPAGGGQAMWVIGGSTGVRQNDVWYSSNGTTWTQATAAAQWEARYYYTGVVYNNQMWVMGGDTASGIYNDIWYSSDGTSWTQATAGAQWKGRSYHVSSVYNNKMWAMGGCTTNCGLSNIQNDVWYSSNGTTWTKVTTAGQWGKRYGHTLPVYGNRIWVIGGGGVVEYNDVWYTEAPNDSETVNVNAVVSAYIVLSVSTTSTYLMPNLVDSSGNTSIGSSTVSTTVSTNDSAGYTLSLQGTYGGVSSTPNLILNVASSTGSSTITAGVDGYGANATSSQATILATSTYNFWGQDIVGTISSTTNNLISQESAAGANRTTLIKIYAATDSVQPSGTYQDYIILTVVGKTP